MKTLNFHGTILVLLSVFLFISCEKNQAPQVQIIKPADGYTVTKGDIIAISVSAADEDGAVSEVRLFLDEIGLAALEFPYNYDLNTDAYSSGEMILKVTARDNEGLESSDEIKIIIDASFSTVSTSEVSSITYNSAMVGGSVSDDGGGEITETGVYWDTLASPETDGKMVSLGVGPGEFSGIITELPHGKKIYYKAYSVNSAGVAFGEERFFLTNTIPTVQSSGASNIDISSAVVGGELTADGGESVTELGVYWSSEPMAELSGVRIVIESSESSFSTTLEGLSAFTTYYFKAFAKNAAGESLGQEESFTTFGLATVNTTVVEGNIYKQVFVGGEVTDNGGYPVSETGVYWGINPNPISSGTRFSLGSQMGSFSGEMVDLNIGSTYYAVAFAVTTAGESVGEERSYKVPEPVLGSITDARDQEVYGTVIIGEQVWMSENLRASKYTDGTPIPYIADAAGWVANSGAGYAWYNNDPEEAEKGAFYNWYVTENENICPVGWHVPIEKEWLELETYLGMDTAVALTDGFRGANVGGMLKTTTLWDSPNTGATNEVGFSSKPTGRIGQDGTFLYQKEVGYYWGSDDNGPGNLPIRRLLYNIEGGVSRSTVLKEFGLSIRCVKD